MQSPDKALLKVFMLKSFLRLLQIYNITFDKGFWV